MRRKRTGWDEPPTTSQVYYKYYNRLLNIALSMFEWKNLPVGIDQRFMELCLFADGKCIFFRDENMPEDKQFMALQVLLNGTLNVYRIPIRRTAFSANGYRNVLTDENSVIIWNNYTHTNSFIDIDTAAHDLTDIDQTIRTNIRAQKTPVLLLADENERLTMENVYKQYDGNAPVIKASKNFKPNQVSVLRTDAPYVADKLFDSKKEIWDETLSALGVPVTTTSKKERLLTDEVKGDKAGSIANQFVRLQPRKEACEQINRMFNLNIDVGYRDLDPMATTLEDKIWLNTQPK